MKSIDSDHAVLLVRDEMLRMFARLSEDFEPTVMLRARVLAQLLYCASAFAIGTTNVTEDEFTDGARQAYRTLADNERETN